MSRPATAPTSDGTSAEEMIRRLQLEPLPEEGGWFRRTLTGPEVSGRGTAAYAVIDAIFTPAGFSALHRLEVDELWMFRGGDPLELFQLSEDGDARWSALGWGPAEMLREARVPARVWQGARLRAGGRWAWVTCVTVPEFTWTGFRLGERDGLRSRFPAWAAEITALTRG